MRGQTSMEFLAFFGILLGILVVFSIFSFYRNAELQARAADAAGWNVCKLVAGELNIAAAVGDGYTHSFYLPARLENSREYLVWLNAGEKTVEAEWEGGDCLLPVTAASAQGEFNAGQNSVSNRGGVVYVE
jgi:hypothetical protein